MLVHTETTSEMLVHAGTTSGMLVHGETTSGMLVHGGTTMVVVGQSPTTLPHRCGMHGRFPDPGYNDNITSITWGFSADIIDNHLCRRVASFGCLFFGLIRYDSVR